MADVEYTDGLEREQRMDTIHAPDPPIPVSHASAMDEFKLASPQRAGNPQTLTSSLIVL